MPEISAGTVWLVFGTALSALAVLGYALFDLGSVRSKNTSGTIVRHLVVTSVSMLGFFFMGFGLFFGGSGGFFGVLDFFTLGNYGPTLPAGVPMSLFVAAQAVVCAVAANIVCGTLAERSNLPSQVTMALTLSLLVYPFVNRWTWGTGWLAALGFHDFGGSASLNIVAGMLAFVAASLMGPRAGKYDGEAGELAALPGQSLTRCMEGAFLILVGWFGVVGVSSVAFGTRSMDTFGQAFLAMLVSASVSVLTAIVTSQLRYGGTDVPMALNGLVGGLVAVSSGADGLGPVGAGLCGLLAGLVVVFGSEWVERRLKVDDPVGAVATHGLCGVLGLLYAGIFMQGRGMAYGGLAFLGVEVLGALAICAWTGLVSWGVLLCVRRGSDLRVGVTEESDGLGLSGPALSNAFVEYMPDRRRGVPLSERPRKADLPVSEAVPLVLEGGAEDCALKKVEIICRPSRLQALRRELAKVGVTGMTVSHVQGCGEQKGIRETYRGVPVNVEYVPKTQVDIVVSKVPVQDVVGATRRALYTGHIGDGKVFVYGVAEAVKVRTGEHGYDAVQGIDDADR